jgi:putative endonuclease
LSQCVQRYWIVEFLQKFSKLFVDQKKRIIFALANGLVAQLNTVPAVGREHLSGRTKISNVKFYTYVLRSINFDRNYIGFTSNLEERLKQHNSGKTKSTKPYKPWVLLFFEEHGSKEDALKREKWLKSGIGRDYIKDNWPRSSTE